MTTNDSCLFLDKHGANKLADALRININSILGEERREIFFNASSLQNRLIDLLSKSSIQDSERMIVNNLLNRMSNLRVYENGVDGEPYIKILTLNKVRGRHVLKRDRDYHYEITPTCAINTDLYFLLRELNPHKVLEIWNLDYIQFTVSELKEILELPSIDERIEELINKMFGKEYNKLGIAILNEHKEELHNRITSKSVEPTDILVYRLPGQDDPRRGRSRNNDNNINLYVSKELCISLPAR